MSPLGHWCVLMFTSLPLGLSSQNIQFDVCAFKNDAMNISLENASLNLFIKQKL